MQDLSCVGQCSLTVVLPVMSALGVETCVLPTALLSNHTMFKKWSCLDLTDETKKIMDVWQENGFKFDAFLTGYLGSGQLVDVAKACFNRFAADGAKIIVDPAFGDNGRLYPAFDWSYVEEMKKLVAAADIVLPNLTEACYLTGKEYRESADLEYVKEVAGELARHTDATVVITGAETDGKIGEIILEKGRFSQVFAEKLPVRYHGTGDLFAAVFTATYLKTNSLEKACETAGLFVADSIRATDNGHTYGVNFEHVLSSK